MAGVKPAPQWGNPGSHELGWFTMTEMRARALAGPPQYVPFMAKVQETPVVSLRVQTGAVGATTCMLM